MRVCARARTHKHVHTYAHVDIVNEVKKKEGKKGEKKRYNFNISYTNQQGMEGNTDKWLTVNKKEEM